MSLLQLCSYLLRCWLVSASLSSVRVVQVASTIRMSVSVCGATAFQALASLQLGELGSRHLADGSMAALMLMLTSDT